MPPEVNGPQNPARPDYNSQPEKKKKAESNQPKLQARNPSATLLTDWDDLLATPRGTSVTPTQTRVSRDRAGGNLISPSRIT